MPSTADVVRLAAQSTAPWVEEVAQVIAEESLPAPLFDIGCADGELLQQLARRGIDAEGIELRPASVKVAVEGRRVRAKVGDLKGFLSEHRSVGTVILSHVLEHLEEPVAHLSALRARCRAIVVAVPNSLSLRALIEWSKYEGGFAYAPKEHVWQMTPRAVAGLLERAGFRPARVHRRPLKPRRRTIVETLRSVAPRSSDDAREEPRPSVARDSGALNKAAWQVFDRSLLVLERHAPFSLVADQIIAVAKS